MRKFLIQILVFLIPFLIGAITLFLLPYPSSFALQYSSGECDGQSYWINDRLEMEEPVDVLLLGSSRMIDGVDDQLLTELLSEKEGERVQVMNAGFCRLGRDIQWWLFQEVTNHKKPETVVLEVREEESFSSHPVFGHWASVSQLTEMPVVGNASYLDNWYKGLRSRLDRIRYALNDRDMEAPWHPHPWYGHGAWPDAIDTLGLQDQLYQWAADDIHFQKVIPTVARVYLERLVAYCDANHIELYFLYLPALGKRDSKLSATSFYRKHGELITPPDSISHKWYYYRDNEHLNSVGATWLTKWLADQMKP